MIDNYLIHEVSVELVSVQLVLGESEPFVHCKPPVLHKRERPAEANLYNPIIQDNALHIKGTHLKSRTIWLRIPRCTLLAKGSSSDQYTACRLWHTRQDLEG